MQDYDEEFHYRDTYYKIVPNNMMHHKCRFKIGLNELSDRDPWDKRECTGGGFYFCDLFNVPKWLHLYPNGCICEIMVPYNAIVSKQPNKYKANKIIVSKPVKYSDFIEKHKLESLVIEQNGMFLCYIKNLTQDLCIRAVEHQINAFKYVDSNNQTNEFCQRVVDKNGLMLQYVKNKTNQICIDAVKQNGMALKFIPREYHDYELYVIAIKNNALSLKFVFLSMLTDYQCKQLFDLAIK